MVLSWSLSLLWVRPPGLSCSACSKPPTADSSENPERSFTQTVSPWLMSSNLPTAPALVVHHKALSVKTYSPGEVREGQLKSIYSLQCLLELQNSHILAMQSFKDRPLPLSVLSFVSRFFSLYVKMAQRLISKYMHKLMIQQKIRRSLTFLQIPPTSMGGFLAASLTQLLELTNTHLTFRRHLLNSTKQKRRKCQALSLQRADSLFLSPSLSTAL